MPINELVSREWHDAAVHEHGHVQRLAYELCREIYIPGANRWRNPEDDLPAGFEQTRELH